MTEPEMPYAEAAYRAESLLPLPAPQKARERAGEDLLPFGDYADIDPQQHLSDDVELVQYQESQDPDFYQSKDWWWDDQRIRFLKSQLGLSILLMAVPVVWFMAQLGFILYLTVTIPPLFFKGSMVGAVLTLLILTAGFFSSLVLTVYSTQSVMNFIVWLCKPLHSLLNRRFGRYTEDRCSEFNRQTGLVRFARGRGKRPLVAPFIEFDGYIEHVVQRGGGFYKLMLVHRYTGKEFHHTSFSQTVTHKQEVHAQWDMLQRYMDVSQPLLDMPRLEPFRDRDPVSAEHDRRTGRDRVIGAISISRLGKTTKAPNCSRRRWTTPGGGSSASSRPGSVRSRWRNIESSVPPPGGKAERRFPAGGE